MPTRQMLVQSLQKVAQKSTEEDLFEMQRYAEYLANTRPKDSARLSLHELPSQHDQQSSLLITYILERSRLISMVNHLADIILHAENLSANDKWEAQEAMKRQAGFNKQWKSQVPNHEENLKNKRIIL